MGPYSHLYTCVCGYVCVGECSPYSRLYTRVCGCVGEWDPFSHMYTHVGGWVGEWGPHSHLYPRVCVCVWGGLSGVHILICTLVYVDV